MTEIRFKGLVLKAPTELELRDEGSDGERFAVVYSNDEADPILLLRYHRSNTNRENQYQLTQEFCRPLDKVYKHFEPYFESLKDHEFTSCAIQENPTMGVVDYSGEFSGSSLKHYYIGRVHNHQHGFHTISVASSAKENITLYKKAIENVTIFPPGDNLKNQPEWAIWSKIALVLVVAIVMSKTIKHFRRTK